MNGDAVIVKDDRKMIPVSPDTHRRVMAYAGRLTAEWGARTSMETAINYALDIAGGERPAASNEDAPQPEVADA